MESYDEKGVAKNFKPEAAELLEAALKALKRCRNLTLKLPKHCTIKLRKNTAFPLARQFTPRACAYRAHRKPGLFDVMVLWAAKNLERMEKAVEFIKNM